MAQIKLPVRPPRPYQKPLWGYMQGSDGKIGGRRQRAVAVWHRRAGKDLSVLDIMATASVDRVGIYYHMLPTLRQGRQVVWDGRTTEFPGVPSVSMTSAFPEGLVRHVRNDEMKMELHNGSLFQVCGSDNYDQLMGTNPVGLVMSEYSLSDPAAWSYFRPILAANNGWAIFIYTPRGDNHGQELLQIARSDPDWFAQVLTVDDTCQRGGDISPEDVDSERKAGMVAQLIQQEFYCSFEAPVEGAYYADQLAWLRENNRITDVPHDPAARTETWGDIGIGDSTAIWFVQHVGKEVHVIDFYQNSGEPLGHYISVLDEKSKKKDPVNGYLYGDHVLPHDIKAKEFITGRTRESVLKDYGIYPRIIPQHRVEDGIEAVRSLLPRCWIDEKKCRSGIAALRQYRKKWDDRNKVYIPRPVHDWTSHPADAFRYGAMKAPRPKYQPIKYPKRPIV